MTVDLRECWLKMVSMHILFILLLPLLAFSIRPEEQALMDACQKREPNGCEQLGAYYLARENWENSFVIGEALCKRESIIGCTYAGTALLAQKKGKEGLSFLNKSCDKFEPFACRSLGRFFKEKNGNLSHLYFRRACHYGLEEVCRDLSKMLNWPMRSTCSQHADKVLPELVKQLPQITGQWLLPDGNPLEMEQQLTHLVAGLRR